VWAEFQWPNPTFRLCEVEGMLAFGCTPLIFSFFFPPPTNDSLFLYGEVCKRLASPG